MKKVTFYTLGCKVNQYETQALKEQFMAAGYTLAKGEPADVYVINTCTVTNIADRKSRQYVSRAKNENSDAIIAVIGCYPQREPERVAKLEGVDLILGTADKGSLLRKIDDLSIHASNGSNSDLSDFHGYDELGIITSMDSRTRAYIKIEDGCDRYCSYCAIPYARGPVRSRALEDIIKEAKSMISQGFKEIVLTGINAALYGSDFDESGDGINIIVNRLNSIDADFRIRIGSLEPTVIDAEYVKRLLKYEKLCPHFHLSLQSGSDNVLSAMNRRYSRQEYLNIVSVLKEKDSNFGISTDIIVGFPGETEEDFSESLSIVRDIGFLKVHVFQYSERSGTNAAQLPNKIDKKTKVERSEVLISESEQATKEFLTRNIGTSRTVLFEKCEEDMSVGLTENGIKVYFEGKENRLNEFTKVKLKNLYKDGMK